MADSLWTALALLLILEGLLPFVAPRVCGARRFASSTELTDGQLRFIGLISIALGLAGALARLQPCVSGCCPKHIEDVLPAEAARIEALRRALLDHFRARGYRLVQPPLVEHLDSLLTGTGRDLDLQTFKVVDPLSGRLLGVRADITPQVARIDAHLLNEPGVTRLCYAGSVLRTVPHRPGRHARGRCRSAPSSSASRASTATARCCRCCCRRSRAAGVRGAASRPRPRRRVSRAGARRRASRGNGDDAELFAALRAKDVPGGRAS